MAVKSFSKKEAIQFGWEMTKNNFVFLITITIVMGLIQFAPDILNRYLEDQEILKGLINITAYIVGLGVTLGSVKIYLMIVDHQKPEFSDLFSLFKLNLILRYFVASTIYGIAVVLGLFLLIMPGLYIATKYIFFVFVLVDKDLGVFDSYSKSGELTRGKIWDLFLFLIIIALILLLGLIAFGIGIFVAMPIVSLALAYVYRKLTPPVHHPKAG